MLRSVAAFLVAVLTSSAFGPVTCEGWQSSAVERMACCERASHDCPDQAAADTCCAQQEQIHQPGLTIATMTIAASALLVALPIPSPDLATPQTAPTTQYETLAAPQLHAPPGSFELPLRI